MQGFWLKCRAYYGTQKAPCRCYGCLHEEASISSSSFEASSLWQEAKDRLMLWAEDVGWGSLTELLAGSFLFKLVQVLCETCSRCCDLFIYFIFEG